MATKIAIAQHEFVADQFMADVDFTSLNPTNEDLTLDILPSEESDYFERKMIERAERRAKVNAKRSHVASVAHTPEFDALAHVAHALTVAGTRHLTVSANIHNMDTLRLVAGAPKTAYTLARIAGDDATVYAKRKVSRMTVRGQESVTEMIVSHVDFIDAESLLASIKSLAPERVKASRRQSSVSVESGKVSRKKWQSKQSRLGQHDSEVNKGLLRNAEQAVMFDARASIESKLANGEPVLNAEWKVALGRSLTVTEMKATKRQRDGVKRAGYESYGGQESAMSRMLNSLERK